jgi:hypothetical protein
LEDLERIYFIHELASLAHILNEWASRIFQLKHRNSSIWIILKSQLRGFIVDEE